jgi:peptidoglycan hydrolase-like protein with peptidoglycan-binding domain/DNA invertase Pin-like site-specific DNA recombinase
MKRKHCVGVTRAAAASIMACLALLCLPAVSFAAAPSDSRAEAANRASALLARGAGYGKPQGEPRVRALQRRLRALGHRPGPVDGLYGPLTEAAVERLQRDTGLSADGIVGPQTRRVLNTETPPLAPGAGYGEPGGSPQVREVQRRLRAAGQRPGPVDGRYGPRTRAAIERFQGRAGQPANGVLSPATAVALARADRDEPAHSATDTRGGDERGQRAQRPASPTAASGPDDRPRGTAGSGPAGGSDQSRTRTPAAGDRAEGTDGDDSTSPVLWVVLALAVGAICGVLAGWLMGRRGTPEPTGVADGSVGPRPMPNGGREAARPTAGSTVRWSPEPRGPRDGIAALGYVSARAPEAVDGQELRDQMAAIDTACWERGLALDEVIADLVQVKDTRSGRPGLQYALQRLEAGEASCLVVAELGRLSGSAPEVGYIVDWLRRRGARLVAVDDGLDTGTTTGGKAADMLVSLGGFDGEQRSPARTGHLHPVPEQRPTGRASGSSGPERRDAPAVKERIKAMRASGMTLQAIADQLNADSVPTLRGGTMWRPSGVQAAAGYSRPVRDTSEPPNGPERDADDSSGEGRERSRRPAVTRGEGAAR